MRHVEFLVEEESAKQALHILIPKILGIGFAGQIHAFQGKHHMLKRLPGRLRGYRQSICEEWEPLIAILVDADSADCRSLKAELEDMVAGAGLSTCRQPGPGSTVQVMTWIAVEELEAWFLGDASAVAQAYPRIPATFANRRKYRDPDAVSGGTWEALEKLLQEAGYYQGGLGKVDAARRIATHMNPCSNRSRSFLGFAQRLTDLLSQS